MWTRIRALVIKEFLLLWKDRRVRNVVLIPPLIQVFLFTYAATFDIANVPLGVWDEDRTPASRELVARFEASDTFARVASFDSPATADDALTSQQVYAVLHIGQRFADDLARGAGPAVQLLLDGRRSNTALIVNAYANAIVSAFDAERLAGAAAPGPRIAVRSWFNPNLESRWFILPALVALLPFIMTMLITALSIARERELGTFDQLLMTPLRPLEILVGKVLPALAFGLFETCLLIVAALLWFGLPLQGSTAVLIGGMLVFLLSGIAVGLAISSIAQTQQQAILGAFMFLSPAVILSGLATPIENMPVWCQWLTLGNPIRYMIVVSRGVFLRDIGWEVAVAEIWPMGLIGLSGLALATWLFRRRVA